MKIKKYGKEKALEFYKQICRVRAFDQTASDLFLKGVMSGNIHTCLGQEAIAVGAIKALGSEDLIATSHRGHGQCLMCGADSKKMFCELFGKTEGYCKGKGGSMHIADLNINILGANGIVGAGIPMAAGSALASKIKKDGRVTIVFFGDASTNTGEFHEALNMASAWHLPVVFFCENNKYGVSTNIDRVCNVENLSVRAKAYDIPGVTIDGNDVFEVYETVVKAVKRAREGKGPTLIEGKTYRHHGHYEGDPQVYKTPEEIAEWMAKDPIEKLEKAIIEDKVASKEELNKLKDDAFKEMEEAGEYAHAASFPDPKEALTEVYYTDNERCISR